MSANLASMPSSPPGDIIPLRNFNLLYQSSPSMSPKSTTSPLPDVADALVQYHNEILGGPPVTLTWKDVKVLVTHPDGSTHTLVDNISGFAEPFSLVAIVGAPKSGKTTLLRALSGRLVQDEILEGEILLNGRRQQITYGTAVYLTCDGIISEMLTVEENMYIAAVLKLPPTMSMKQKLNIVEQTILDLSLKECSSKQVGWCRNSKSLTQGERRRLVLAMEIVMRPRLLYLDEVTDGLNGSAALLYMTKVKLLAGEGRTVLASFQELNQNMFELFDYLLILGSGRRVYFGEARIAHEHLTRSGLHSPVEQNLVGYFLQTQSADYEEIVASMKLLQDLEKVDGLGTEVPKNIQRTLEAVYESSGICSSMAAKITGISIKKGAVLVHLVSHATFVNQIVTLAYRSFVSIARDLGHYWARFMLSIFAMLLIGTIFVNLDHSISSIQERASCLFLVYEILVYMTVGGIPYFHREIKVVTKEKLNAHYSVAAFIFGSFLSAFPFLFITALFSSCFVYFLVGLHSGFGHFFYFFFNLLVSLVTSEGLMMTISALVPISHAGMIVGSCIQTIFMLVAGYTARPIDIPHPIWTYPMSYLSFHRYGIWGLYQNEFQGLRFQHSTSHMSGQQVIDSVYHMVNPGKWGNILVLLLLGLFYRVLLYVCLMTTGTYMHALGLGCLENLGLQIEVAILATNEQDITRNAESAYEWHVLADIVILMQSAGFVKAEAAQRA
ncbi:hypothetical protein GOP47_0024864 [Adiantum capillus-veneris]|uniref:ABC transporter domain-containing protein n=1 Tax=Adiantum capillus-veneris TaxID=13818 RepID=A0A9D4Z413_ADICA|nr:hypothetical protein GOP47_0024864 [Adiantum capillus-veneris]